jgi:hypothetical protein
MLRSELSSRIWIESEPFDATCGLLPEDQTI